MVRRWRCGERPTAQEFLASHPQLAQQPELAVALIYEEVCLRREDGLPVSFEEVVRQFPQWREQLEMLWECHQLLEEKAPAHGRPALRSQVADFLLLHELGRGSQGAV